MSLHSICSVCTDEHCGRHRTGQCAHGPALLGGMTERNGALPTAPDAIISEIRDRLACACRVLGRLDLTKAATGHASARIPGREAMLIRARGPGETGVRYTEVEQVIAVDFDGRIIDSAADGLKPPLEVYIHAELYRARPDVNAVVHMHPPLVVASTAAGVSLEPIYGAYDPRSAQLAMDGLARYDRAILIDSAELGREFCAAMGDKPACIMHGHGVTTASRHIEDAALTMILVNELATMHYHARVFGVPQAISVEDQAAIAAIEPVEANDSLSRRSAALWRYYRKLTGD